MRNDFREALVGQQVKGVRKCSFFCLITLGPVMRNDFLEALVGQQNRVRVKSRKVGINSESDETPLCFSSLSLSYSLSIGKSLYPSIQLFLKMGYFTPLFTNNKEYESAPFFV
jgi:hypothetical protein